MELYWRLSGALQQSRLVLASPCSRKVEDKFSQAILLST